MGSPEAQRAELAQRFLLVRELPRLAVAGIERDEGPVGKEGEGCVQTSVGRGP